MSATANTPPTGERSTRRELLKGAGVMGALVVFARFRLGGVADHRSIASSGGTRYLRPPGAISEAELVKRCIRCHKCGENCSNAAIRFVGPEGPPEARGTPYLVPREKACILCMRCNNNCPSGALQPIDPDHPALSEVLRMGTASVDQNICLSYNGYICGVCIRSCPLSELALRADNWEKPVVDPEHCVGCGLCEQACIHMPQAIRVSPSARASESGSRA